MGRAHPQVGVFIRGDYSYRSILLSLYPLVHRSVGITQIMDILTLDEAVRSSDLKTGLSSGDEFVVQEVALSSQPFKAFEIISSLKGKDVVRIKEKFQFPSSVNLRIPSRMNRACSIILTRFAYMRKTLLVGCTFPSFSSSKSGCFV